MNYKVISIISKVKNKRENVYFSLDFGDGNILTILWFSSILTTVGQECRKNFIFYRSEFQGQKEKKLTEF